MTQLILAVNLRRVSRQIPSSEFVDSKVLYSYLLVAQSEGPLSYIFEPGTGLTNSGRANTKGLAGSGLRAFFHNGAHTVSGPRH